jgi:dTMP kinase
MARGALIVLEGAEGVGKTTQARRLAETLRAAGIPCTSVREPGGTHLGEAVRAILLDGEHTPSPAAEALLFLASRAQLVADTIRPALARGEIVVLDRFFLSTYAYQVAGRGLGESAVRAANQLAIGDLVPDVTLVLALPSAEAGLERASARGARDRMEQVEGDFHARVAAAFDLYADEAWQDEHDECGAIERVSAEGTEDDVFARVAASVSRHIPALTDVLAARSTEVGA